MSGKKVNLSGRGVRCEVGLGLGRAGSFTSDEGSAGPETRARRWVMSSEKLAVLVPADLGPWSLKVALLMSCVVLFPSPLSIY